MPKNSIGGDSTFVLVMAWCRQKTSHYLSNADPDLCCHMMSLDLVFIIPSSISFLKFRTAMRSFKIFSAILNDAIWLTKVTWSYWYSEKQEKIRSHLIVNTVPGDGQTPLGAKLSAGTVLVTKFASCIFTGPALEGFDLSLPTLVWNSSFFINSGNAASYTKCTRFLLLVLSSLQQVSIKCSRQLECCHSLLFSLGSLPVIRRTQLAPVTPSHPAKPLCACSEETPQHSNQGR